MSALHMESQLRPGTLTWSAFIVVFLLLINLGTWRVHEMAPTGETGWICSFPATADAHGCYHQETFARGANYPDNNFGNYKTLPSRASSSMTSMPMGPGSSPLNLG